jgi:hypothetical protein
MKPIRFNLFDYIHSEVEDAESLIHDDRRALQCRTIFTHQNVNYYSIIEPNYYYRFRGYFCED